MSQFDLNLSASIRLLGMDLRRPIKQNVQVCTLGVLVSGAEHDDLREGREVSVLSYDGGTMSKGRRGNPGVVSARASPS